jgi:hypothetical protein
MKALGLSRVAIACLTVSLLSASIAPTGIAVACEGGESGGSKIEIDPSSYHFTHTKLTHTFKIKNISTGVAEKWSIKSITRAWASYKLTGVENPKKCAEVGKEIEEGAICEVEIECVLQDLTGEKLEVENSLKELATSKMTCE